MRKLTVIIVAMVVAMTCVSCGESDTQGKPTLTAAFDHEYVDRPEYERFGELYGFQFDNPQLLDPALVYRAVNAEQVDVVDVFTTDGRIEAYDLRVLNDDRQLFPPYDACILVRDDVVEEHPELKKTLEKLSGKISRSEMQKMNYRYSEKSVDPADVAREFLKQEDLLNRKKKRPKTNKDLKTVVVGSKHFAEQKILGNMIAQLIQSHTEYPVEKRLGLQGTKVCFSALRNDEIDLYVEYTGTGLANILDEDYKPSQTREDILKHVREEFGKKWDLQWLEPLGFANSYALAMREKQAKNLGIEDISDLKPYVK